MIQKEDLEVAIRLEKLDDLTDNNDLLVDDAVLDAVDTVKNALFDKYDVEQIFQQTGSNRNRTVMRWLKCLSLYYLYERVPASYVPERIIKNYDDTRTELNKINDAKLTVDLPRLTVDSQTGEKPKTNTRWSSTIKRSL